MFAAKRYLAVSIDFTVSSSSIFRAVSSEGAQKIGNLACHVLLLDIFDNYSIYVVYVVYVVYV